MKCKDNVRTKQIFIGQLGVLSLARQIMVVTVSMEESSNVCIDREISIDYQAHGRSVDQEEQQAVLLGSHYSQARR